MNFTLPANIEGSGFFGTNTTTCPAALCGMGGVFNDVSVNGGGNNLSTSTTDVAVGIREAVPAPVPEPATLTLTSLGMAAVVRRIRRRHAAR